MIATPGAGLRREVFAGLKARVIDAEQRVVDLIASTENRVRDNGIIRVAGWDLEKFKLNPVGLWAHDYQSLPISKVLAVKKDRTAKVLRMRHQFAGLDQMHEWAEIVFNLIRDGFLNANSVGFRIKEFRRIDVNDKPKADGAQWAEGDGWEALRTELYEDSIVPVGSDPDALVERSVAALGAEAGERFIERLRHPPAAVLELPWEAAPEAVRALATDERSGSDADGWGDMSEPSPIEVHSTPAVDADLLAELRALRERVAALEATRSEPVPAPIAPPAPPVPDLAAEIRALGNRIDDGLADLHVLLAERAPTEPDHDTDDTAQQPGHAVEVRSNPPAAVVPPAPVPAPAEPPEARIARIVEKVLRKRLGAVDY